MMLLTKENRKALPPIGAQDGLGFDATAHVKFFTGGRYTFFITEYDGADELFGYCVSALGPDCDEWGYASLTELTALRGRFGQPMERDRYFAPQTVREALAGGRVRA